MLDRHKQQSYVLPNEQKPITLGFREFFFLSVIFFFGFYGFSLCLDKINKAPMLDNIDNITVHNPNGFTTIDQSKTSFSEGYKLE